MAGLYKLNSFSYTYIVQGNRIKKKELKYASIRQNLKQKIIIQTSPITFCF